MRSNGIIDRITGIEFNILMKDSSLIAIDWILHPWDSTVRLAIVTHLIRPDTPNLIGEGPESAISK